MTVAADKVRQEGNRIPLDRSSCPSVAGLTRAPREHRSAYGLLLQPARSYGHAPFFEGSLDNQL